MFYIIILNFIKVEYNRIAVTNLTNTSKNICIIDIKVYVFKLNKVIHNSNLNFNIYCLICVIFRISLKTYIYKHNMSDTYLYSINRVINIDNSEVPIGGVSKRAVIGTDANQIYQNLNDSHVTSQCRIIGGTWTDDLVVNNIKCHPSAENNLYINGQTNNILNIALDGNVVNMQGSNINITSIEADSITNINGKTLNMGEDAVSGTAVTLYGKSITMGEQDTETILHSKTIRFNDNTDGTRFVITDGVDGEIAYETGNNSRTNEALADYGALIEIGSGVQDTAQETTAHIKLNASKITINAEDELNLATAAFGLGIPTDPAYFLLNNNTSDIQIGANGLQTLTMHGSNINIGESNGTVKIFGNVEMYSEGSNIVTNTNIETTSAFEINNTGTKTALTVVQTNEVSSEKYNLCEFFCSDNQDRTPFRIDAFGRVGMGVKKYEADNTTKRELKAWLHVYKNSPADLATDSGALAGNLTADDIDIFLVEDSLADTDTTYSDNNNKTYDGTPFVIKNKGDVGIGTYNPRYKLDVWSTNSELNGQKNSDGIIGSKGIALRDVVYIKQNNTNRILYGLGDKLYVHSPDDNTCITGFEFSWNRDDTSYASFTGNVDDFTQSSGDGTFAFRMTCKLHVAGNDGHIAFRRFEIFVNPQNATFNSKAMPAHVTIADMFDSAYDHYEFPEEPTVIKQGDTTCILQIKWKLRNTTGSTAMPTSSRAYLDVEFFGHEGIGDISATPYHKYYDGISLIDVT